MRIVRSKIALTRDEDRLLRKLYIQWRIPRGQFKKHPEYLSEFVKLWNQLSGRDDEDLAVYHYIESEQKHKDRLPEPWPTFNGAYRRLEPMANVVTPEAAKVLRSLYILHVVPLDIGTDGLCYRTDLLELLSNEFYKQTKIRVPGMLLAAFIETEARARGGAHCAVSDSAISKK